MPRDADPLALARAHVALGYGAAYCPDVAIGDTDRIAAIEKAFAAENVMIAEVGIWRNLISPDDAERKANLDYAAERLALADAVGAKSAVSYIGSFAPHTSYAPHPDNITRRGFRRMRRDRPPPHRHGEAETDEPLHRSPRQPSSAAMARTTLRVASTRTT